MALREFTDSQGRAWKAWDVPPHRVYATVRATADRRVRVVPGYAPERRVRAERRRVSAPALEHGWVCFESGPEKRRLAPPPPDWADAPEGDLETLCERAAQGTARA